MKRQLSDPHGIVRTKQGMTVHILHDEHSDNQHRIKSKCFSRTQLTWLCAWTLSDSYFITSYRGNRLK